MTLQELVDALDERRAFRWLIGYTSAAWGLTEATGFLIDNYGISRTVLDVTLFLVLVFLPVTLVLVWFHGAKGHRRVMADVPERLEALGEGVGSPLD